jgi:hypothetical protein
MKITVSSRYVQRHGRFAHTDEAFAIVLIGEHDAIRQTR